MLNLLLNLQSSATTWKLSLPSSSALLVRACPSPNSSKSTWPTLQIAKSGTTLTCSCSATVFETLNQLLSFFEYGVMVGTADDQLTLRDEAQQSARDNVLFELGLFTGRLGREKVFSTLSRTSNEGAVYP